MRISDTQKAYIAITLVNTAEGIVSTMLPPYLKGSGYSLTAIGVIASLWAVFSLLAGAPSGMLYKPRTATRLMQFSLFAFALTFPFYTAVGGGAGIIAVQAVNGIFFGVANTLNMAAFMDLTASSPKRARSMAYYATVLSGGFAIGNSVGGLLVDNLGFEWAFRVAALVPAAGIAFCSYKFPERQPGKASRAQSSGWRGSLRTKVSYALDFRVMLIALSMFSVNSLHYVMNTFFPLYGVGIGLSLTSVGFLRGTYSIFGTVTRPLITLTSRLASTRVLANIGLVLTAVMLALLPSFTSAALLFVVLVAMGTVRGMAITASTIDLAEEVGSDAEKRGMAAAVFNMGKGLGTAFGPVFGGLLASSWGIEGMFRYGSLIILAIYFIFFGAMLLGRARRGAPRPARAESGET